MIRIRVAIGALLVWTLSAGATLPSAAVPQHAAPQPPIVDKATEYVTAYVKSLTSVVSEERYEQQVTRVVSRYFGRLGMRPDKATVRRVLVSDYLLVQLPGTTEWMPFRDVYSIDGVAVRDRNDRLLKLFVEPAAGAVSRAMEIRDESSRYNIGDVTRDINVPTFALEILTEPLRRGFEFLETGKTHIDGVAVVEVEYRETESPTLIRGREGEDVPARGRFWIRPDTGAVFRTLLETRPEGMRTRIDVMYRYESTLDLLVPAEMSERHELDDQEVVGRSTYSKFRRFRVDATFDIK